MATTSPSGIKYPLGGDLFNPLALKDLADSTQAALNTQANSYSGTNAERIAHTEIARPGTLWSCTDGTQQVYQFRNGSWWPEYEFAALTMDNVNQNAFPPQPGTLAGVHVHSFGRFAVLAGNWDANAKFSWAANSGWKILGTVPAKFRPAAQSVKDVTWGWQPTATPLRQVGLRVEVIAGSGAVQVNPIDSFYESGAPYTANISMSGITWPIAQGVS